MLETGSFCTRPGAGRPKRVTDPEMHGQMEEKVLRHLQKNATTSTRVAGNILPPSHSTVWRVLHENVLHPFLFQRLQALNVGDYPRLLKWNNPCFHQKCFFLK